MCDKNVLEKRVIKSKKTLVYFNTAENFPKLEDFSFIEKYIKNMKKENSYNYTPPQLNDAEDTCLDDKTICCDNNHNADICVDDNTICSDNNCDEVPCLDDKAISSDNICSDNNCSEDICVDNDAMSSYNNRNEYTEVSPKNTNPKTIKYAKAKSKKSKHSKSKSKSARQNVIKSEKIINKNISSSKITPANIKNYENKPEKVISQKTLKEVHYDDKSSSDKALNNSSNNPSNNFFNLRQHPIYLKQKLMLELLHILGLNPKPSIKNQTLLL